MIYEKFNLRNYYKTLEELDSEAFVEIYIQESPPELNESYPKNGMIVCPGSGYQQCTRREAEPVASKLLAMGFNVFVLTYSCAPLRYPVQLLEVAALYDLIDSKSKEWNTNATKTGILGFSAGGHLAAHYSTSFGCKEITDIFTTTHKPYTTVLCYPVITAEKGVLHAGSFENLLGHYPTEDDIKNFSCHNLVNENTPPTFIWHTAEDEAVPVQNSLRYAEALSSFAIPYTLHIYPHGPHGLVTVDKMTNLNLTKKESYGNDWLTQLEKWFELIY